MIKIYSKGCQYALRLLTYIPVNGVGEKFLAVDLCRKARVPVHSARKILQQLVQYGYFEAVPGPGGGYRLLKDPKEISLLDIITLVDGTGAFNQCILGLPSCSSRNPCPAHELWSNMKEDMMYVLSNKSLFDLMDSVRKRNKV